MFYVGGGYGQLSATVQGVTGSPPPYEKYTQVFPLVCTAGLFDFSIINGENVLWVFPDGTTSTADRPTRELIEGGTVLLFCTNFSSGNIEINSNSTDSNYVGDLADFPTLTYYADFSNTNVSGDISALSNLAFTARFANTNVSGVLNPHPKLRYLHLQNTNLSQNDVDQTVINLDNNTVATGTRELNIRGLKRTSASTGAINSLIAKGWNVTDAEVV